MFRLNKHIYELDVSCINNRLERWANWKMSSGVSLGYPSSSAFTVLRVDNQSVDDTHVADDKDCIETNEAIDRLPFVQYAIIRVEYLSNYSQVSIKALKCGISKRTYYQYLQQSKEMIANNLNIILNMTHDYDSIKLK